MTILTDLPVESDKTGRDKAFKVLRDINFKKSVPERTPILPGVKYLQISDFACDFVIFAVNLKRR